MVLRLMTMVCGGRGVFDFLDGIESDSVDS